MWTDLRVAARQLAKHRTFTLAAVVALAIVMSATTTMFTIIHGVYFRDLPFADQEDRCLNEPLDVITIGVAEGLAGVVRSVWLAAALLRWSTPSSATSM